MLGTIRKIFILFFACIIFFMTGYIVHRMEFFPFRIIEQVGKSLKSFYSNKWYYKLANDNTLVTIGKDEALDWPAIVTSIDLDDSLVVKIINNAGHEIHKWNIEWFELWGESQHLPKDRIPRSRPGSMIHGVELIEDGSIVFNFENLGLIRIDKFGKPIWKLPYLTHHSITREDDILWVCGQKITSEPNDRYPNYIPPFIEPMLLKVSLSGKIIEEISVLEILLQNNLHGLLSMPTTVDLNTNLSGDIMHLNDVEPFPEKFEEGYFKRGDIMISIRNINTILIFNATSKIAKNIVIGDFVRQHDPDFVDGNTISLYDNFNIGSQELQSQSRIIKISFPDELMEVYYHGNQKFPFNSNIMGKHQWLDNGNLLVTDPMNGRAFEINENKDIVWEYINVLGDGTKGVIQEVTKFSNSSLTVFER